MNRKAVYTLFNTRLISIKWYDDLLLLLNEYLILETFFEMQKWDIVSIEKWQFGSLERPFSMGNYKMAMVYAQV